MFDNSQLRRAVCIAAALLAVLSLSLSATTVDSEAADTASIPTFRIALEGAWNATERAQLQALTAANGPFMRAVVTVMGPPATDMDLKIIKDPSGDGKYDHGKIRLPSLSDRVLAHEFAHAIHDSGGAVLVMRIWEEGLAAAAEAEVLRLMRPTGGSLRGTYPAASADPSYIPYEGRNANDLAFTFTEAFTANAAVSGIRYAEAGYAFSKLLIEDPLFLVKYNQLLFGRADPNRSISQVSALALSRSELVALMASVSPQVEGMPTAMWSEEQHIFDTSNPKGCSLAQDTGYFELYFFCQNKAQGVEVVQKEALVRFAVYDASNKLVFSGQDKTSSSGLVGFEPILKPKSGRLRLVASATAPDGTPIASTYWKSGSEEHGMFGVVIHSNCGKITFRSPGRAFKSFSVPVEDGAFVAPSLAKLRGQVSVSYSGPGGTSTRLINKHARAYEVVLTQPAGSGQGCPKSKKLVPLRRHRPPLRR